MAGEGGETLADVLDGPTVENGQGGKQSLSPYLLRGLPPRAILRVGRVLHHGAFKYEPDPVVDVTTRNWHKIPSHDHLEHLMMHLVAILMGDESDDHDGHLATRALFYLEMRLRERNQVP